MISRRQLALSVLAAPLVGAATARAEDRPIIAAMRLTDRRIMMDVMFNGQGPFPFVVDTGAVVSGLREDLAQRLQLKRGVQVVLNGRPFPMYTVDDLVLGGAVRQQKVQMFGLPGRGLGGAGLLAAGMMTTYDSELDFDRQQWRIHPNGQNDRQGYKRLASTFQDFGGSRRILADVKVGGKVIRPMWDTGMPPGLSLDNVTAKSMRLWNHDVPFAPARVNFIHGPEMIRVVRGPQLTIGDTEYPGPLVCLRPLSPQGQQPMLGLSFIRTLNVAIDASARAIWVRRNSLPYTEIQSYSPSGLWLDVVDSALKVGVVGTGSPAALAGVRVGDVLEDVTELDAGLRLINTPDRTARLKLRRGGETIEAVFTPRLYL